MQLNYQIAEGLLVIGGGNIRYTTNESDKILPSEKPGREAGKPGKPGTEVDFRFVPALCGSRTLRDGSFSDFIANQAVTRLRPVEYRALR